jgi:hypothetical protein
MNKGNITPQKVNNSTVTNDSDIDEILDKKLKRMIIRMVNEVEEDMNKHE